MWTRASNCNGEGQFVSQNETTAFSMTSTSGEQAVNLHISAHSGVWYLCYKPSGGNWFHIGGKYFTLLDPPTFSPSIGLAGSVTTFTFDGGDNKDLLVITAGNCSNAHLVQSSTRSLARTTMQGIVQTTTFMNATAQLTFCYAAFQTGGDTDGDFVALGSTFAQIQPLSFGPLRIVTGAAQVLNLRNVSEGDQLKFRMSIDCSLNVMNSTASSTASSVYFLGPSANSSAFDGSQDIVLHNFASNGTWYACYKPTGGIWTHVRERQFAVISKPSFSTDVGMAGHVTPLVFSVVLKMTIS